MELIDDGCNVKTVLPPKGMWGELTLEYRPCLPEKSMDYILARKDSGRRWLDAVWKLFDGNLLGWSVTAAGQPVPVAPESLRKVPAPVVDRIVDVLTGYSLEQLEQDEKN